MREKLPDTRPGLTLHFTIFAKRFADDPNSITEVDGYVSTGVYEDGRLGEFFVKVSTELASMGPMLDQFAVAVSTALQYGVPVSVFLKKFVGTRFEPSGAVTGVEGIKRCTSPLDLICRWLLSHYENDAIQIDTQAQEIRSKLC